MGITYQIRLSVVVLSVFRILAASEQPSYPDLQQPSGVGEPPSEIMTPGDISTTTNPTCEQMPLLTVAVLPWPPYAGKDSDGWQSNVIKGLRAITDLKNITFRKVSSVRDLQRLLKTNETVLGFPLIRRYDSIQHDDMELVAHPGLDFLVAPQTKTAGEVCIETLLQSWPLLALSLILTGMAGILIWLLEMIGNREEFPRTFARGSWEGFWWAFISMTTVGYGDRSPRSIAGRCFAVIWIFAGLIIVAVFMANVTTALTSVSVKPEYKISEGEVGVVSGSLEERVAKNYNAETKDFENYDKLLRAFREQKVWKIVIDRYTANKRLQNETATFRQQIHQSKHFTLSSYHVIANMSQSKFENLMDWEHRDCFLCVLDHIKGTMTKYLAGPKEKSLRLGISHNSSSTTHSFNLFTNSKDELERATYISLAILAGLIFVGVVADNIFWKVKARKLEEHELKVCEDQDIMQDIAKGKELLKELQVLYQNLEQKINSNPAWKLRKSEAFSSVYSKKSDS